MGWTVEEGICKCKAQSGDLFHRLFINIASLYCYEHTYIYAHVKQINFFPFSHILSSCNMITFYSNTCISLILPHNFNIMGYNIKSIHYLGSLPLCNEPML